MPASQVHWVHYIPIATTATAAALAVAFVRRGSMAKAGIVEALCVGKFVGLILIWIGERTCSRRAVSPPIVMAGDEAVAPAV